MTLTAQGGRILQDFYAEFRAQYLERHPGSNENEVERAFLCAVCVSVYGNLDPHTRERIESIQ